jgi:phospholipase C
MYSRQALLSAILLGLCSCGQSPSAGGSLATPALFAPGTSDAAYRLRARASRSAIQHVIIIVQENRSVDNLFQSLRGARTWGHGLDSRGRKVRLQPRHLAAPYDTGHAHIDWLTEYAGGAMNGFDQDTCRGTCPADAAYAYVPKDEVTEYYTMAQTYAFADEFFATDQAPSFVSHQYLVSGTSTVSDGSVNKADNNPETSTHQLTGGCDAPQGSLVWVINPQGFQPPSLRTYPCFQRQSLMNELDAAGVSWKYYQASLGAGIWNAPDAIYSIWSNPTEMAANVITPPSQVLTDIANGQLADVVWVTPTKLASDHPNETNGSGPSWVASVVNAVGRSQYWDHTAIFIVWDEWGGFYDHVTPTIYNSLELGFRVPMIVVSPYAKRRYVSHVQHEFGSILKFTEETFGLPSLRTTDARADNLSDCFNFGQRPLRFRPIRTKYPASYFFKQASNEPIDD